MHLQIFRHKSCCMALSTRTDQRNQKDAGGNWSLIANCGDSTSSKQLMNTTLTIPLNITHSMDMSVTETCSKHTTQCLSEGIPSSQLSNLDSLDTTTLLGITDTSLLVGKGFLASLSSNNSKFSQIPCQRHILCSPPRKSGFKEFDMGVSPMRALDQLSILVNNKAYDNTNQRKSQQKTEIAQQKQRIKDDQAAQCCPFATQTDAKSQVCSNRRQTIDTTYTRDLNSGKPKSTATCISNQREQFFNDNTNSYKRLRSKSLAEVSKQPYFSKYASQTFSLESVVQTFDHALSSMCVRPSENQENDCKSCPFSAKQIIPKPVVPSRVTKSSHYFQSVKYAEQSRHFSLPTTNSDSIVLSRSQPSILALHGTFLDETLNPVAPVVCYFGNSHKERDLGVDIIGRAGNQGGLFVFERNNSRNCSKSLLREGDRIVGVSSSFLFQGFISLINSFICTSCFD